MSLSGHSQDLPRFFEGIQIYFLHSALGEAFSPVSKGKYTTSSCHVMETPRAPVHPSLIPRFCRLCVCERNTDTRADRQVSEDSCLPLSHSRGTIVARE